MQKRWRPIFTRFFQKRGRSRARSDFSTFARGTRRVFRHRHMNLALGEAKLDVNGPFTISRIASEPH